MDHCRDIAQQRCLRHYFYFRHSDEEVIRPRLLSMNNPPPPVMIQPTPCAPVEMHHKRGEKRCVKGTGECGGGGGVRSNPP